MSVNLSLFDFELSPHLIAQSPTTPRDASCLMILNRYTKSIIHETFKNLTSYLSSGDLLVMNNSRVLPARLFATGANKIQMEFLLIKQHQPHMWEVMVKPGKRAKIGSTFEFEAVRGEIIQIFPNGHRLVKFTSSGDLLKTLEKIGNIPLPPYIKSKLEDVERYQTIYSKSPGSIAAPTAGLHFTAEIFNKLIANNISVACVTLHVGLGTFKPVKVSDITKHQMHEETFTLPKETAQKIIQTKNSGGRVIAVGTTSCRVLESVWQRHKKIQAEAGTTNIFIYPGYKFKVIDGLITNFHLPKSTLLMLVSAFAGRKFILGAYLNAIENHYRFLSFGDAMLIL
ncbi:MAG: tRNA preQ1(34) S-adenosylmethionine ribosyltransferase-isomerase QueA [Oscillospiraceae bacterium]|jgi:S-adenosylmethionine:tRNA ribosyltransferase-isomerase|nr:tRNA preQ1(34) S-adenosylmethionine ribosyltransferase-isomerase QueA [Oscillospiraceae bacterium]